MYRRLALCLISISLGACSAMPHAPLVYVSRQSVGLDIHAGPGNGDVSGSIGFKNVDAAWIPTAICDEGGKTPCKATWLKGRDGVGHQSPPAGQVPTIVATAANPASNPGHSTAGGADDALSVFGTFDGRPMFATGPQGPSGSVSASKLFATGLAARKASAGDCLSRVKAILDQLHSLGVAAADIGASAKLGLEACSER